MAAEQYDIAPQERGSSAYFCSNPRCIFHVRVGQPRVQGFGDWATLPDGTTVSHRWMRGQLLCDLCAARSLRPPQQ